jgi:hypothetical protein
MKEKVDKFLIFKKKLNFVLNVVLDVARTTLKIEVRTSKLFCETW